jgi:hypothetical protein
LTLIGGIQLSDPKNQSNHEVEGLSILDALSQLRSDIAKLQSENADKGRQPLFEIYEGELELKLVAKSHKEGEVDGKAKWKLVVFSADVGGKGVGGTANEQFQTLRIKFRSIRGGTGGKALIGDAFIRNETKPSDLPTFEIET